MSSSRARRVRKRRRRAYLAEQKRIRKEELARVLEEASARASKEEARRAYAKLLSDCAEAAEVLREDDRILAVTSHNAVLEFETDWITTDEIKGERYFIARFGCTLCFDGEVKKLHVEWLESSCDVMRYKALSIGFCFGTRESALLKLIGCRECLAAAYYLLELVSHINPDDYDFVAQHYRKVPQEPERKPKRWIRNVFRQ